MGFTKGMDTTRIDISIHRKIGEVFTEVEVIIKTAVKTGNFTPDQRGQAQRKIRSVPGALRVYMQDVQDLTSAQKDDITKFQASLQAFASKITIEKNPAKLLPQLQALRVELDDLLG